MFLTRGYHHLNRRIFSSLVAGKPSIFHKVWDPPNRGFMEVLVHFAPWRNLVKRCGHFRVMRARKDQETKTLFHRHSNNEVILQPAVALFFFVLFLWSSQTVMPLLVWHRASDGFDPTLPTPIIYASSDGVHGHRFCGCFCGRNLMYVYMHHRYCAFPCHLGEDPYERNSSCEIDSRSLSSVITQGDVISKESVC